jgi:hypothetical protein
MIRTSSLASPSGPDEMLEFYEFEPGIISYSGAGTGFSAVVNVDFQHSGAGQIWDTLSNDAPRPPALKAALVRQSATVSSPPLSADTAGKSSFGGGQSTPPAAATEKVNAEYVGGYCDTDYWTVNQPPWNRPLAYCNGFDWELCRDNWWDGIWAQTSNVYDYYVNSCAKVGSHTLSALWRGAYGGSWTVPEETGRWYRKTGNCGPFNCTTGTARSDVLNAVDSEFNFRHEIVYEP